MSRAGSRIKKYRPEQRPGHGRLSNNKIAWLRTQTTQQISIQEYDPEEYDEENEIEISSEQGSSYILFIPVPGRARPLFWNLTAMTTEELEATRQFFEHLFNLADPIVRERDKVAANAFAKGDDSYNRVYRQLPQFITRQREKRADSKSLRKRPESPLEGIGSDGDLSSGVRGSGNELANSESQDSCSQDNRPTTD